jgi:hypothetical protein
VGWRGRKKERKRKERRNIAAAIVTDLQDWNLREIKYFAWKPKERGWRPYHTHVKTASA